ncbi:hypothetical protein E9232_001573 [Inquilinus ginsengisoli]|uniref:Uncharacterized protein n=1 Tax=Inquilinus ginsengisoli TaxID=363840 RepID=A0ABU1JL34_9PROT|nr:hypothetical protein [Inquilinus ginsengisoli]MDR6289058.1 hypothetical protein [Inquilinus ginsengisoli]
MTGRLLPLFLLLVPLAASPAWAQDAAATPPKDAPPKDDWPCVQVLQPELSIGAMWPGDDPTASGPAWRDDAVIAALVDRVAPRRVPVDEATAEIHRFAIGFEGDRKAALTELFAGVFETINTERGTIIRGIRRFNSRQEALAQRIEASTQALDGVDPASTDMAVAKQRQELEFQLSWDQRVFDDRERLLPAICDQPFVLERRMFALSRSIQEEIGK